MTLGRRRPLGLEFLPVDDIITSSEGRWAEAANLLLDSVAGEPAYFFDDDIEFVTWMPEGGPFDITGFCLFAPTVDGQMMLQSAGFEACLVDGEDVPVLVPERDLTRLLQPTAYSHVTASCMWLSPRATAKLRFPVWREGEHYEDVAFTYSAWMEGLTVGRVPLTVHHHMDARAAAGFTKAMNPEFQVKRFAGERELNAWMREHNVRAHIETGRIPSRSRTLEQVMMETREAVGQ